MIIQGRIIPKKRRWNNLDKKFNPLAKDWLMGNAGEKAEEESTDVKESEEVTEEVVEDNDL